MNRKRGKIEKREEKEKEEERTEIERGENLKHKIEKEYRK